jgi:hypothetical protein
MHNCKLSTVISRTDYLKRRELEAEFVGFANEDIPAAANWH